jgi:hypothetical protein
MSEVKNKSEHQNNSATPVQAPKEASSLGETEYVDARASTFQFIQLQAAADDKGNKSSLTQLQSKAYSFTGASRIAQLQLASSNRTPIGQAPSIQLKKNETGLPDNLKSGMESLSGLSLNDVKVHRNSDKPAQLQAHAYAQGTNIHLGPGQEKHLPHELAHVVQQKEGRVKPTVQMKGNTNVNDDPSLEKEADVMGAKALAATAANKNLTIQKKEQLISRVIQRAGETKIWEDVHPEAAKDPTCKNHQPIWRKIQNSPGQAPTTPVDSQPPVAPETSAAPSVPVAASPVSSADPQATAATPVPAVAPSNPLVTATITPASVAPATSNPSNTFTDAEKEELMAKLDKMDQDKDSVIDGMGIDEDVNFAAESSTVTSDSQITYKQGTDANGDGIEYGLDGKEIKKGEDNMPAAIAGTFGSVASAYALFIHAANFAKEWKGVDKLDKDTADSAAGLLEEAGGLAGNIAGTVENFEGNPGVGKDVAKEAGLASTVGMGFADSLGALRDGVKTIYKIYETYKELKSEVKTSKQEKIQSSIEIIQGLLSSASKTVKTISEISNYLNQGSAGLATAVPGIGAVISGVDIALGIYNLLNSRKSALAMQNILKNTTTPVNEEDKKVLEYLKKKNEDEVKDIAVNIGFDFTSFIGSIAQCIPEATSQIAGLSLKLIAGGGKLVMSIFKSAKSAINNAANDIAGGKERGTVMTFLSEKLGNAEESDAQIMARNKEVVTYIASEFKSLNLSISDVVEADKKEGDLQKGKGRLDTIIEAAGTPPQSFYRKVYTTGGNEGFHEGMTLIYKNLS